MVGTQANEPQDRQKSSRALKTISEAADMVDVPQHVLRFWETKFPQIKPLKRNGGRRFYRPDDIETLRQIKFLLYKQGYTIKGAKKLFEQKNNDEILAELQAAEAAGISLLAPEAELASNDNAAKIEADAAPSAESLREAAQTLRALSKELLGE